MAASTKDRVSREPSAETVLRAVLEFGRGPFEEMDEPAIAEHFLNILKDVLPERYFALRLVDLRGHASVRVYGDSDRIRSDLSLSRLSIKGSALDKTNIKSAVAKSAFLRIDTRWDSPFSGVAAGFAIPIVHGGELLGVLDVGYPLGRDASERDEELMLPLVNQLGMALRSERMVSDTRALRDYQSRLIEHASALILGIDSDWRIRVCNRALCELVGVASDDVVGKDLRDHFPVVDRTQFAKVFSEGMRGSSAATAEVDILTSVGRKVRVVWRVASIRSRGRVQAVVAVGQDQTVLSDLQKQLIHAEKLSTLGQMAAGVVHELNNPLTSISVYSDYLLKRLSSTQGEGGVSPEDLEKLERIHKAADRIRNFTKDLVQYARPSTSAPERVSVNAVITQSLSFCEHLFSEDGVSLQKDLGQGLPDVEAVPGQLEQVVINLVTNAVQACGDAGSVRVRSFVDDSRVVFSVKDAGPGIRPEDQERIFEPFFTTKHDGEGTGLGLSIVRNIIEQNQGEMVLVSEPEEGAEFLCKLPRFDEAAPNKAR